MSEAVRKSPVKYAEDDLGVHDILLGVLEARRKLDEEILSLIADARDQKRKAEQDLEDRETDLLIDERGKHVEMSATALKEHMKIVLHKDAEWRRLRDLVRTLTDQIDGAEVDRRLNDRDIEIGCARMIELGGYLNYLAAAKQASIANKT
jgi:DNA recombination-dependent growth factor C